jgi:TP901 family phage tail tape measure protein
VSDRLEILAKVTLQRPSDKDIQDVADKISAKLKTVSVKGFKLFNDDEINIYVKKWQNAIDRLKIGKDKVFKDSRVSAEFDKMTESINKFTTKEKSLKEVNLQFDTLKTKVAQVSSEFRNTNKDGYSFVQMLELAAKKIAIWGISTQIVYSAVRGFKDLVNTVIEVDTALTEINKVLDLNKSQLSDLTEEATKLGIAYGRTTTEILRSVGAFAKAGLDKKASTQMAELAALLSNVGDMTTESAQDMLIATNAGYQLGNDYQRLNLLISEFNELANKNAVEVNFLADSWMNSASIAKQAKLSIEDYNAILTVSGSSTQKTGKEIGNAWKTILMRLQGVSDGTDTLDEDLSKVEETLNNLGIAIRKTPTEWKPAMESITEIAQKYKELGEAGETVKQSELTEVLAGKYRANVLAATLQNFDQIKKALQDQVGAMGSAEKENARYMDSIQARTKALKAVWEQFALGLINSDWIKNIVTSLKSMVEWIDKTNAIIPVLAGLISGVLVSAISALVISVRALIVEGIQFNVLMGGLPVIIGTVVTGLTALGMALANNSEKISSLNKEQKKLTEGYNSQIQAADKSTKSTEGQIAVNENLAKKLEELTSQEELNAGQKAQLKSIVDQLNDSLPNLNLQIDEQTGKIKGNTQAIYDNIEALKKQAIASAYQQKANAAGTAYVNQQELLGQTQSQLDIEQFKLNTLSSKYGTALGEINAIRQQGLPADAVGRAIAAINAKYGVSNIEQQFNSQKKKVEEYTRLVQDQTNELGKYSDAIDEYSTKALEYGTKNSSIDGNKTPDYIPPIKTGSSGGTESDVSAALTERDRYQELNIELSKTNNLLEENKALQELADDKEKIRLLEEEQKLLKQKQSNLHAINEERRQERAELVKSLSGSGFAFSGEGDSMSATNAGSILAAKLAEVNAHMFDKDKKYYNQLKEEFDDLQKTYDRFIEVQVSDIPKASKEWYELEGAINKIPGAIEEINKKAEETIKKQQEAALSLAKDIIKTEKDTADVALKIREDALNKEERDKTLYFKEEELQLTKDIANLEKAIFDSTEADYESASEKRKQALQDQIDALENKATLDQEAVDRQQKLLDLEKQRQLLANTEKEKNVRMLVGNQWQWVADPRKLKDEREKLAEMESDYATWEADKTIEAKKRQLKAQIDTEDQTAKVKKESYEKQKKILEDKLDAEKTAWDLEKTRRSNALADERQTLENHYANMDGMAEAYLNGLVTKYGNDWDKINAVLKEKLKETELAFQLSTLNIIDSLTLLSKSCNEKGFEAGKNFADRMIEEIQKGNIKLSPEMTAAIDLATNLVNQFSLSGTSAGKGLADNLTQALIAGKTNMNQVINDYVNNLLKLDMMGTDFSQLAIDFAKSGAPVDDPSGIVQTALKNREKKLLLMSDAQRQQLGITNIKTSQDELYAILKGIEKSLTKIATPPTNPIIPPLNNGGGSTSSSGGSSGGSGSSGGTVVDTSTGQTWVQMKDSSGTVWNVNPAYVDQHKANGWVPAYDKGTLDAPGGLSLVHKDELVNLPKHAQVFPADITQKILQMSSNLMSNFKISQPMIPNFAGVGGMGSGGKTEIFNIDKIEIKTNDATTFWKNLQREVRSRN